MFLDSQLPIELIAAYRGTDYVVHAGGRGEGFTLRIGELCAPLQSLLERQGADSAAFLTAWNPFSEPTPLSVNRSRQAELISLVEASGWPWLPGTGVDPSGKWPGEDSALVIGIDRLAADDLAKRIGQNAYVWCRRDTAPELVLTR